MWNETFFYALDHPISKVQDAALRVVVHHSNAVNEIFLRAHVALCMVGCPADDLKVTHRLSVPMVHRWQSVELWPISGSPLFALSVVVGPKQL